jgi:hypothetical protein
MINSGKAISNDSEINVADKNTKNKNLLNLPESSLNLTVDNQTDILILNIGFQNLDSDRLAHIDKFEE